MGSEFSNADMSAPNLDDFKYNLLATDHVDGVYCWKIEVIPADEDILDEVGFDRKVTWIGQQDYVLRKAEYFDEDGELLKVMNASDIKLLDPAGKRYMATKMEMQNRQNGRKSVMVIDQVEYNPGVKDEYFTIDFLEKI